MCMCLPWCAAASDWFPSAECWLRVSPSQEGRHLAAFPHLTVHTPTSALSHRRFTINNNKNRSFYRYTSSFKRRPPSLYSCGKAASSSNQFEFTSETLVMGTFKWCEGGRGRLEMKWEAFQEAQRGRWQPPTLGSTHTKLLWNILASPHLQASKMAASIYEFFYLYLSDQQTRTKLC